MALKYTDSQRLALNDPQRRGILIPANQLIDTALAVGDRFKVKRGQKDLFALVIVKDEQGDILYDRTGIFLERTRRVDMFLGGVFDTFSIEILDGDPPALRIRPLDINLKSMENIIKP
ncbi:MAG: hypothetical protein JJV98_14255 [Desulfosarcina sp.]|nr:hypothetical protein [Desulfobacterales bacterium]